MIVREKSKSSLKSRIYFIHCLLNNFNLGNETGCRNNYYKNDDDRQGNV